MEPPTQHLCCPAVNSHNRQCDHAVPREGAFCSLCKRKFFGANKHPNPRKYVTEYYERAYCKAISDLGRRGVTPHLCIHLAESKSKFCKFHNNKDTIIKKSMATKRARAAIGKTEKEEEAEHLKKLFRHEPKKMNLET